MGWFSSDEIVTTNQMAQSDHHETQAIALCVLAGVAIFYVVTKIILKLHKSHTERLAERVARRAAVHPL